MTAVHKIMGDFHEDPFDLVAVHSSLEDYELVYFINTHLKSKLRRSANDFELSSNVFFPIFEWRARVLRYQSQHYNTTAPL